MKDFKKIVTFVSKTSGVDFSLYKDATIHRRIQRRMALHHLNTPAEYLDYLQNTPEESSLLYHDILITVTSFFRDSQTFDALESSVFPKALADKKSESEIRIWVPACSTGQEPYSIAMCLLEYLDKATIAPTIKIYASDLNEAALETARLGVYAERTLEDVSPERRQRFFVPHERGFQICKEVRELCIFARHDLSLDPPFSRMDLVSCRNMLIYMTHGLQRKILQILHYALVPQGYLLLGPSETVTDSALFEQVDKKNKIYRRRPGKAHLPETLQIARKKMLANLPAVSPEVMEASDVRESLRKEAEKQQTIQRQIDSLVLNQFCPPMLLLDENSMITEFRGDVDRYLKKRQGRASLSVFESVKDDLVVQLRAALRQVEEENVPVQKQAYLAHDKNAQTVRVDLVPIQHQNSRFTSIVFTPTGEAASQAGVDQEAQKREHALLRELDETRNHLRAVLQDKEVADEEYKAANEEIQSSNEELRTANEELETAKEELQSVNEELALVNSELETKNEQLIETNDDLTNLFSSMQIPAIMLGRQFKIRRVSPAAEMLGITPDDIGKSVVELELPVETAELHERLLKATQDFEHSELEIIDARGRWQSLRIRPYKTAQNKIEGAVMTFVDVDELRTTMQQINQAKAYAEGIIAAAQPLLVLGNDMRVVSANKSFYETFRITRADVEELRLIDLNGGSWNDEKLVADIERVFATGDEFQDYEYHSDFPAAGKKVLLINGRGVRFGSGPPDLVLLSINDITERVAAEEGWRSSEERYRAVGELIPYGTWQCGADGGLEYVSEAFLNLIGMTLDEVKEYGFLRWHLPEVKAKLMEEWQYCLQTGKIWDYEFPVIDTKGKKHTILARGVPQRDHDGTIKAWVGMNIDITDRKKMEEALRASEQRYRTIGEIIPFGVWQCDAQGGIEYLSDSFLDLVGMTLEECKQNGWASKLKPGTAEEMQEAWRQTLESKALWNHEHEIVGKDDRIYTVLSRGMPLFDSAGELTSYVGINLDITERKQAESLAAHFTEGVVESVPALIITLDKNGRIGRFNSYSQELTGYSYNDAVGRHWLDTFTVPEERAAVAEKLDAVLSGENLQEEEHQLVTKAGRIRLVRWFASPLRNQEGDIIGITAVGIDVTERRAAERKLRKAQRKAEADRRRLQTVLEALPVGVVIVDQRGKLVETNAAMRAVLGTEKTLPEMAGDQQNPFRKGWHPDTDKPLKPEDWPLYKAVRGQATVAEEITIERFDGTYSTILASAAPIKDAAGKITGAVAVMQDVTDRKEIERRLIESEKRFRRLFNESPVGAAIVDLEYRYIRVNAELCRITGYTEEELLTRAIGDITHPDDHPRDVEDSELLRAGTADYYQVEKRYIRKDGSHVWARVSVRAIRDEEGNLLYYLPTMQDITEIRQKEEQLRQVSKMEAIGKLAGGVAHDFNNYLTAIKGFSLLLSHELPESGPMREALDEITNAAEGAAKLTRQLLTFGRKSVPKLSTLNLNRILQRTSRGLQQMLGEDIQLVIDGDPNLGNINADAGQLEQIIMNMAANARDAMPAGGELVFETANIYIDANYLQQHPEAIEGPHAVLVIRDSGTGIDEMVLAKIFDPFFTTKPTGEGTGLGLATVHGIVKQSDGHITVESAVGEGTTFRLYFPVDHNPAEDQDSNSAPRIQIDTRGSETIMVIEDEEHVREFIGRALSLAGYEPLLVATASEALEETRRQGDRIHLFISDVVMPKASGPELVEQLQEILPDIPALYISGYTRDALVGRGLDELAILTKPFTPEELYAKVRQILEETEYRRRSEER